jgi:hypothetical protein
MVLVGRHSDRTLERRYHAAVGYLVCAIGLVGIGIFASSPVTTFAFRIIAVTPPQRASGVLADTYDAARGHCSRNCYRTHQLNRNRSGWFGPSVVGWPKDLRGKTSTGLSVVAGLECLAAVLILFFVPNGPVRADKSQHQSERPDAFCSSTE